MSTQHTLIRASRARSCIAHWDATPEGDIRLVRVSPNDGPLPDVGHLVGAQFRDLAGLRLALIAAMKGPVGDTLDRVLITRAAYDRVAGLLREIAARLPAGTDPDTIPDERARPISGGRLLVWVDLPTGERASVILEKGEWGWRPGDGAPH